MDSPQEQKWTVLYATLDKFQINYNIPVPNGLSDRSSRIHIFCLGHIPSKNDCFLASNFCAQQFNPESSARFFNDPSIRESRHCRISDTSIMTIVVNSPKLNFLHTCHHPRIFSPVSLLWSRAECREELTGKMNIATNRIGELPKKSYQFVIWDITLFSIITHVNIAVRRSRIWCCLSTYSEEAAGCGANSCELYIHIYPSSWLMDIPQTFLFFSSRKYLLFYISYISVMTLVNGRIVDRAISMLSTSGKR